MRNDHRRDSGSALVISQALGLCWLSCGARGEFSPHLLPLLLHVRVLRGFLPSSEVLVVVCSQSWGW